MKVNSCPAKHVCLEEKFFAARTTDVAKQLLGKVLVHRAEGGVLAGMIVETEAYIGPHDKASHASRGRTKRTEVMFGNPGTWYVYMIYGMYYCLNVVTEPPGYPSAVLIRALEPLEGVSRMKINRRKKDMLQLTNGPGKLCQALGIDKRYDNTSGVSPQERLYLEDWGLFFKENSIKLARRIGVDYAGPWKNRLLRFYVKNNNFVSVRSS